MPEVLAAPPPSAPAAPPAPPAAPAAPAAPATKGGQGKPPVTASKPVSQPSTDIKNAYDQLDRLAAAGDETPADDATPTPDAPSDQAEASPEKPEAAPPAKPEKAGTLRQLKDQAEANLVKANARIKELETATATPKADPEKVKLQETLNQREKRLADLEEEFRFSNYEKSDDYKTKYETPFVDAYGAGRRKVESFKLLDANGNERAGTAADFDSFMRITDDNDAAERAVELFGNKASMIMYHREQVQQLNAARVKAIADYRANGGERERVRNEAATKHRQAMATLWETEAKSAIDNPKYAPWFKAPAGDTVGAELLEKGFEFADEAFGKAPKDAEGRPVRRTPEETAKMHAVVRNKAAAFDYQIHRNQVLSKENRALKKKLADFESSVPGPGNGRGKAGLALTGWAAIDADLARRADR